MIDSVIKVNKKYYPQTLLEECKYTQEKIKIEDYISEDFEDSGCDSESDSESDSNFNNESESNIGNEEQFAKVI